LVTDGYNQTPLASTILITDAATGAAVDTLTTVAGDGVYAVYIPSGKTYKVEASSPNYNNSLATVIIPLTTTSIEIEKDFQLSSLSSVTTILRGKITDVLTKAPLGANLIVKDNVKELEIANIKTDPATGEYEVAVPSGKIYSFVVKAPEYMALYDEIDIPMSQKNQVITKNAELNDLKVGSKIVLKNIFYDFDKSTLRPASIVELEHLIELLNDYPTMRIEISSHTDNKGTPEYNIVLSNNRSKSCVDYLISKKVDKKRLEFKGYGLTQPIATNETDAGRQLNRRTEFKILSR
jgi:outer membrane protein OmpA-like peptidoglycan-associated protein